MSMGSSFTPQFTIDPLSGKRNPYTIPLPVQMKHLSRNNTTLLRAIQQFSVIVSDVPNIFADLKRFHLISREWPQ